MPVPAPPFAAHYVPPPTTKENLPWVEFPIVDLSKASTPEGRAELMPIVRDAMHTYGFMYVINHGLTQAQNERMCDVADVPLSNVAEEEKKKYVVKGREIGIFRGYKPRQYFHIDNGVHDQIENYSTHIEPEMQQHPEILRPFLPEMTAFNKHNHYNVLHPILRLLAQGLELPEDTFVKIHSFDGAINKTFLRFQKYFPYSKEDGNKANNVWLKGHLGNQPVSALQVKNPEDRKHRRRNGDVLGRVLQARHPPRRPAAPDQRGHARLGLIYFTFADDDVKLVPFTESPVVQRLGVVRDEEKERDAPTMLQWIQARTKAYGVAPLEKRPDGTERDEVMKGIFTTHYN
ncbi:hypothetical protein C8Q80DRAFT_1267037 [Daedaleopsis nitida]|nr:hypothetical protein C8Q80DRAFT_1267037 [Daedaleopsis nitida]